MLQKLLEVAGPHVEWCSDSDLCAGHPLHPLNPEEPRALEAKALRQKDEPSPEIVQSRSSAGPHRYVPPPPTEPCANTAEWTSEGILSALSRWMDQLLCLCQGGQHLGPEPACPHSVDCQAREPSTNLCWRKGLKTCSGRSYTMPSPLIPSYQF